MLYSELASAFERLDATSSRLEMTSILSEFFRSLDPGSLRDAVYLSQGKLHPDYFPQEFGMADKLVLRAVAMASAKPYEEVEKLWIKEGDPGTVAELLIKGRGQMTLFSEPLTLERVVNVLTSIENTEGKDSQDKKMKQLFLLLRESGPVESKYLCRIVTGRMRVGAGAMTILDALSEAFATREGRPDVERAYNVTCDLGLVAKTIASGGMDAIRGVHVSVGSPIKVMLAERLSSIPLIMERMGGRCAMEFKYDGIRLQAHISKDSVRLYSRRLEDLTSNFPDVAAELRACCKAEEAIIEGECVAVDPSTGAMLPFQTVTHRRKKHGMDKAVEDYPVRMFMFDILFIDGTDMTSRPFTERRDKLAGAFELSEKIGLTEMEVVEGPEEGEAFFARALAAKSEGVMAKSLHQESVYRAGSRGFLWIKYKKDYEAALTDSFDLAVVGAFYGMGKRAGKYGALLMAIFDSDTGRYSTVCKLGTGFDDAFLDNLPEMMESHLSKGRPSDVDAQMTPDIWFFPAVVLEVVAAEISLSPIHTAAFGVVKEDAGLGLRFPRFTGRVRSDKGPEQCTTAAELAEMYWAQDTADGPDS
ncbi:MAG: ATP-dependent DNA ligase [Candidatus Methanoplasma sp.]|jgi:DNA ligase-1|nr:ATP-dependent DNA ligase [Candidatus Methanoplasma sp.]